MTIFTLDDRDPSIVYSGGWDHGGSSSEFDKTTTWTDVAGSTAKLTFQGTGVGVFGTISVKGLTSIAPVSSYSIDGGAPVEFTAIQQAKVQYNQRFFVSPVLPSGTHTLTITNDLVSDPLFLDYIAVAVNADPGSSTASSSSSSASSSSSSSSSTSASSSTTSLASTTSSLPTTQATSTSISTQSSSTTSLAATSSPSGTSAASGAGTTRSSNSGAIAGGIIAVVIALILIVFGVIFWRRKQKRRRDSLGDFTSGKSDSFWVPNTAPPAQPFVLGAPPPPRSTQPQMTQADNAASYPYTQPRYPGGYVPGAPYNSSGYANPAPAASVFTVASSNETSYYGQEQSYSHHQTQEYPSRAYIPPSQLINNPTYGYAS